jgi:hypothetical protein
MAGKLSKHLKLSLPPDADALTLIKGIGPSTQAKLYKAGIIKFEQLADLSVETLVSAVPTLSMKRAAKMRWIQQARTLSGKVAKTRKKVISSVVNRQHYENFTIGFLLDEKKEIRRIRVVHIQSGDVDTCSVWDAERLIDFLSHHVGDHLQSISFTDSIPRQMIINTKMANSKEQPFKYGMESALIERSNLSPMFEAMTSTRKPFHPTDNPPLETKQQQSKLTSDTITSNEKVRLIEWRIVLSDTDQLISYIHHDLAFDVKLALDLKKVYQRSTTHVRLHTTFYAKQMGSENRQVIGQIENISPFDNTFLLVYRHAILEQGVYRLEAWVSLDTDNTVDGNQLKEIAFFQSGPLQVY